MGNAAKWHSFHGFWQVKSNECSYGIGNAEDLDAILFGGWWMRRRHIGKYGMKGRIEFNRVLLYSDQLFMAQKLWPILSNSSSLHKPKLGVTKEIFSPFFVLQGLKKIENPKFWFPKLFKGQGDLWHWAESLLFKRPCDMWPEELVGIQQYTGIYDVTIPAGRSIHGSSRYISWNQQAVPSIKQLDTHAHRRESWWYCEPDKWWAKT